MSGGYGQLAGSTYVGATVYREAALDVLSTLTHLAWDATSSAASPVGVSLDAGDLLFESTGRLWLAVTATIPALAGLSGVRLQVVRDPGGAREFAAIDMTVTAPTGAQHVAHVDVLLEVEPGDRVRTYLAVGGVASAPIATGVTATQAAVAVWP